MLPELMVEDREKILERWFEGIIGGYPAETGRFLREQRDQFGNPVGHILREQLPVLVDGLIQGRGAEELKPALDPIIRIRAVQDFSPAQAVGFIFELKRVIRERAEAAADSPPAVTELAAVDAWIDRLVLAAFDVYAECREKLYSIRVNEIRNRSLKAMERLNEWRSKRDAAEDHEVAELE